VDLEHHRKRAKALVRAFRAGDTAAHARASAVLGDRAQERFLLSDAQHVVAVERGFRSWPELKRAAAGRSEETIVTRREYVPGDPVVVHIVRRRLTWVSDRGGAVERAGRPPGWRTVAEQVADELIVNISRAGVVSLPVTRAGLPLDEVVARIAEASLALHEELLELDPGDPAD
jgi:hypothetical protein